MISCSSSSGDEDFIERKQRVRRRRHISVGSTSSSDEEDIGNSAHVVGKLEKTVASSDDNSSNSTNIVCKLEKPIVRSGSKTNLKRKADEVLNLIVVNSRACCDTSS